MNMKTTLFLFAILAITAGNFAFATTIDTHFHFLTPGDAKDPDWAAFSDGYPDTYAGAEQALKVLKEANVDKAVALSAGYFFKDLAKASRENTFTSKEVARYPDKLIGFCGVNLSQPWAVAELERCKKDLKLVGLKLHFVANKISLTNEAHVKLVTAVFEKANELKMPILVHAADGDAEFRSFVRLTWKFPDTRFIIAHARNVNYREMAFVPMALAESPSLPRNLYADISGTITGFYGDDSPEMPMIVWYLRKFGIDRVFMGSDFPVRSVAKSFANLEKFPFTAKEKEGLRGKNFERFLNEVTPNSVFAK